MCQSYCCPAKVVTSSNANWLRANSIDTECKVINCTRLELKQIGTCHIKPWTCICSYVKTAGRPAKCGDVLWACLLWHSGGSVCVCALMIGLGQVVIDLSTDSSWKRGEVALLLFSSAPADGSSMTCSTQRATSSLKRTNNIVIPCGKNLNIFGPCVYATPKQKLIEQAKFLRHGVTRHLWFPG